MRLRTDGRGAGGDIVGVRGCARTGSLGDAGVGNAGQDGATLARRDHRCRHGRSSRVRDAEQGPTRAGSHAHLERYPAPHANTSIEEATGSVRVRRVGLPFFGFVGSGPPFAFSHEPPPLAFAAQSPLPLRDRASASGYQPEGMNPRARIFATSEGTSTTAIASSSAFATKSVLPSRESASAFGVEPS